MTRFLNLSSRRFKKLRPEDIAYCESLFDSFLTACSLLDSKAFASKQSSRFNISTFEAVFVATTADAFANRQLVQENVLPQKLDVLKNDPQFIEATQKSTASSSNVLFRRNKAKELLL